MDLCQQKRGVLADMKYLDDVRVDLHYALPLGEIVYDFFDAIKSRSRGYASYDYEFKEYRESDLVKLDFLLNGDPVDALSMIVFRDNAYAKGRRICEKLRDNIPRTLFEIPVQAAIGGKIIARETVKAMRKDVLAKCYGGDISRKKETAGKAERGQKEDAPAGQCRAPQRGLYRRAQAGQRRRLILKLNCRKTAPMQVDLHGRCFVVFCQILCYHKNVAFRRPRAGKEVRTMYTIPSVRVVRRSRYCGELYLQVA